MLIVVPLVPQKANVPWFLRADLVEVFKILRGFENVDPETGMLMRPEGPRPRPGPSRPRPGPSRPRPEPSRPRPRLRPEQWTLEAESRPTRSRTSSTNILNIDYCFLKLL